MAEAGNSYDPTRLGIAALRAGYRSGRLDPVEVTGTFLERIAAADGELHAFITVSAERALAEAGRSRDRWRAGRPAGALDGIPLALKDNIDVAGIACTAGTAAYRNRVPGTDAEVQRRLAAAGAVLLGKLNMHEGALGATTDNPIYGRCMNPLRPGHTPGGSSGGSGAAVAAGLCAGALGTDTMGSVRVPASYCGVFGYKPTTGAVPSDGVVPLSHTLDSVGPLARTAADAAELARSLLGAAHSPIADWDTSGSPAAPSTKVPSAAAWSGLHIGVLRQLESITLEPPVARAYRTFLDALATSGARIVELDLPEWNPGQARRAGLLISEAEGYAYWKAALGEGLAGLSAPFAAMLRYPERAGNQKLRAAYETIAAIRTAAARLFGDVDLLALPTTPQLSFAHTELPPIDQADCTALANFTGSPAFALPVPGDDLPASVQLLAAPGEDWRLLDLAEAIDRLAL